MELRHLRYFVAVVEEGSLTAAAERRLHTAQPSLSRQLRDLENIVGVQLLIRGARGVQLTPAGLAFLDHARLALGQADQAIIAARRAARPTRQSFAVCFLAGEEVDWLPQITQVLRSHLPNIDLRISSHSSPDVADAVQRGEADLGVSRVEPRPDVVYQVIAQEPIVAILPSNHRLAAQSEIDPRDFENELFIGYTDVPHVLRATVDRYFKDMGLKITPTHLLDSFGTGISLVASTGGVSLLPAYIEPLLPWSVVSRRIKGKVPVIDLAVGYRKDNVSPILKTFLESIDKVIAAGPAGERLHDSGSASR